MMIKRIVESFGTSGFRQLEIARILIFRLRLYRTVTIKGTAVTLFWITITNYQFNYCMLQIYLKQIKPIIKLM